MKILLVGDYSGVHSELANALKKIGHHVVLFSDGDGYKNYPRDISPKKQKTKNKTNYLIARIKKIPAISYAIEKTKLIIEFSGLKGIHLYTRRASTIRSLNGFDVVQIINPIAIESFGALANLLLIRNLHKNNKKLFMCALGDDYSWVTFCLQGKFKYSALDRVNKKNIFSYSYSSRYVYGLFFRKLHKTCESLSEKIIPGLYDYRKPYIENKKTTETIPIPISKEHFSEPQKTSLPIKILHGWQLGKDERKGNKIIHEAILRLISELGDKTINYTLAQNLPFEEYKNKFDNCDILMDQCFSYDRGANAALGMCKSKVVFSGFEPESIVGSEHKIGINCGQSVDQIYADLKNLITNPEAIDEIKSNAYIYAKANYESIIIAKKYISIWTSK